MLKFEWMELPDWTDNDYWAQQNKASTSVIAWEFLRRNPKYRADTAQISNLMAMGDGWLDQPEARIYKPPRLVDETEHQWMCRVVQKSDIEPTIIPIDSYIALKWGLEAVCDPLLPFTQGVRFLKPGEDYPRLLASPADIDDYTVTHACEEEGDAIVFSDWCAPFIFDVTRPLDAQLRNAGDHLRERKRLMKAAGTYKKAAGMNEKPSVWIRHLRVIDALRTVPRPTSEHIALVLGGNAAKNGGKEYRRKQGDNFIRDARLKLNADHRHILRTASRKE